MTIKRKTLITVFPCLLVTMVLAFNSEAEEPGKKTPPPTKILTIDYWQNGLRGPGLANRFCHGCRSSRLRSVGAPPKALQPTANPLRGLSAAELRRYVLRRKQ